MLIIGCFVGTRSEQHLCENVHFNPAYRGFYRLRLDGGVPDHSPSRTTGMAVSARAISSARCLTHSDMADFRVAFPDFNAWRMADLIAVGGYVGGEWDGGGTHMGPAFKALLVGSLPPATGRARLAASPLVMKT
jgi:hypothetical protein